MEPGPVVAHTPADLLGPLNEVERRNAPARIFTAGRAELVREGARVAVVGSRKVSAAGRGRTVRLARFLAERQVTIVSGLALGVDTTAHRTALECGGSTIAVLGTPENEVYLPAGERGAAARDRP
jgi:DNA processing protein